MKFNFKLIINIDLDSNLCAFPDVNCPGDKTQYPARCDLTCNVEYKLVGWKTVLCRSIGSWSPSQSYCKLINEPPYDVNILYVFEL